MRRAAVLLCSLLLVAVAAPPAAAQRATPVEGGGSFTDAPVLAEGSYSDTIRMTEELLYGVELAEGQALEVTAQMLGRSNAGSDAWAIAQLQVYSSLRDRWSLNELEGFDGESDSKKWNIKTPAVGSEGREFSEDEEFFAAPGVYYFSLKFFRNVGLERNSPILKREFKTRYEVKVTGTAVEPAPTPTPTPTSTPEPSPTETEDPGAAAAPVDPASSDTPYVRVYLMTFLIGLLAGFGVVSVRGLAGRRSSPAAPRRGT
ncbi:MAG: hypothetical protein ACRDK3_02110 [Actinomycetota bacterium]